mmetsp:Transcript_40791/g.105440  ORF Transcript_40791/g.105440 Transcript_40791/m.105440 type:complete len:201 (+) Transcript_40791:88-690(+)
MTDLMEPTKPVNAYWLWLGENRESLTKEAGSGKGSAVGKLAGQKWKTMSEAAKKPYEKKAEALKQEYEQKMADFVAAGGVKGKRRAEKAEAKAAKGSKKARKEARAASGQPKKPPTGYWLYLKENREAIEKAAGSKKPTLVASLAGKKWKAMSDAQKKPFEDKAAMAKVEYQKAMEEWKKNGGGQEEGDEEEEDEGEEDQ